jgi:hypothetical protein
VHGTGAGGRLLIKRARPPLMRLAQDAFWWMAG